MKKTGNLKNFLVFFSKKIILMLLLFPCLSNASTIWTGPLSNWNLTLDNGVIYITASNLPANCSYGRAQIDTSTTYSYPSPTYQRDIYAFVLAQQAAGKTLQIVVNDSETVCKVYGAKN
jgi:hypothetical protein